MISQICLSMIMGQARPSASQVVSMLTKRYANASSVAGTIYFKQSIRSSELNVTTLIQYVRPSKLFIKQTSPNRKSAYRIIADGSILTYNEPSGFSDAPGKAYYEQQKTTTVGDAYAIGSKGLLDRSPALDMIVARREHLQYVINQWATLELAPSKDADGNWIVQGKWREYGSAAVSGNYTMSISPAGDLKKYVVTESTMLPNSKTVDQITSAWTVDVKVNAEVNASLFNAKG